MTPDSDTAPAPAFAPAPASEGLRLAALIEVLYATGLRVSELAGLPLSALSRDGRMLTVRGKGYMFAEVQEGD